MRRKIFLSKVFQRKSLVWVLSFWVIFYPLIAEGNKTAELADRVEWSLLTLACPSALNVSPWHRTHTSCGTSCVMKICVVLYLNTISDLTQNYNHSAITLFHSYKENKTQWGFFLGAWGFLSPLSCNVKFTASLKAPGTCLDPPDSSPAWWIGQPRWLAVILLVSLFAASTVTSGEPRRETKCKDLTLRGGTEGWAVVGGLWLPQLGGAGGWTRPALLELPRAPGPVGLQPCTCSHAL